MQPRATFLLLSILLVSVHALLAVNPDPEEYIYECEPYICEKECPKSAEDDDCAGGQGASDPSAGVLSASGLRSGTSGGECAPGELCVPGDHLSLAIAPNEPGLGVGIIQFQVTGPSGNLADRANIDFHAVTTMEAKVEEKDGETYFKVKQASGTPITFLRPMIAQVPEPGSNYGRPTGAHADSQAEIRPMDAEGNITTADTAVTIRQYRAGNGYVDFPANGGPAKSFTTTEGRKYTFPMPGVEVIRDKPDGSLTVNQSGGGLTRQIKTKAGMLDVVPLGDRSFEVRKYAHTQIGTKENGLWTAEGEPLATMKITAPQGETNKVEITKNKGGETQTSVHTMIYRLTPEENEGEGEGEGEGDGIDDEGFEVDESWLFPPNTAGDEWTHEVKIGNNVIAFEAKRERATRDDIGPGHTNNRWTSTMQGDTSGPSDTTMGTMIYRFDTLHNQNKPLTSGASNGSGSTGITHQRYDFPPQDPNGRGNVSSQTFPSGEVIAFTNDETTRRMTGRTTTAKAHPAAQGSAPANISESHDYQPLSADEQTLPVDFRPRTTTVTKDGVATSRTYQSHRMVGGGYNVTTEAAATPETAFGDPSNSRSEIQYHGPGPDQGRPAFSIAPDGSRTTYEYVSHADGSLTTTTTANLRPDGSPAPLRSVKTTVTHDPRGLVVSESTSRPDGAGWAPVRELTHQRDKWGNLTSLQETDLLSNRSKNLVQQTWDGERLLSSTDQNGVTTTNEYFEGTSILQKTTVAALPAAEGTPGRPAITTTFSGRHAMGENLRPTWETLTATTTSGGLTTATTTTFDQKGRATSVAAPGGFTSTVSHSADGLSSTLTGPNGATTVNLRDSDGNPLDTSGTAVIGTRTETTPRPGGGTILTARPLDPAQTSFNKVELDARRRTLSTTAPAPDGTEATTTFAYGTGPARDKPTLISRPGLPATAIQYDTDGLAQVTGTTGDDATLDPASATDRVTAHSRDLVRENGKLWLVTTTATHPDPGSDRPVTLSTTRNLIAGFTGNQTGHTETTDLSGATTTTIVTEDPATATTTLTTTSTAIEGTATSVWQDGLLIRETQPGGVTITHTYDALRRPVSAQHSGYAAPTTVTYHGETDLIATLTDPSGATTSYTWGAPGQPGAGQLTAVTGPDGKTTNYQYDTLGRLTKTTGAHTYPVEYTYDAQGRLHTMTTWQNHANNQGAATTTWNHHPATGHLLNKQYPDGTGPSYTYDQAGRPTRRDWVRNNPLPLGEGQGEGAKLTTTYTYHPQTGDLTQIDYSDDTPDVTYTRDRLGRLTSAGGHTYTYHTDTLLPETAVIPVGLTEHQRKLTFTRDALLRLAGLALGTMAPAAPATDYAEAYTYDALSRAATLTATSPGLADETFTTTYHAAKPHLIASVGGTVNTTTFEHEPLRDILTQKRTALTGSDPQTTSALALYTYTVNNIGQRTSASSQLASPAGLPTQDTTINYTYNDKGELETATHGTDPTQNRAYTFDDIGNRTQSGTGVSPVSLTTYTSNNLNQYTGITPPAPAAPVTPTHDADGNTLDNATHTFTYDGENRLKTAHRKSDGALVATYSYDHASRRVRKQTTAAAPQGATDTAYVYQGWTLLATYDLTPLATGGTPALKETYTWGSTGLQRVTTQGTAPAAAYPLIDANKNINGYSDATGAILARYDYDPFGNTTAQSGPQATQFAHRFSSEIHDEETGLLYYGYRYYHPPTGTWLTRDPIGEYGGLNLYGFVGNDGVNYWDLWGLDTRTTWTGYTPKGTDHHKFPVTLWDKFSLHPEVQLFLDEPGNSVKPLDGKPHGALGHGPVSGYTGHFELELSEYLEKNCGGKKLDRMTGKQQLEVIKKFMIHVDSKEASGYIRGFNKAVKEGQEELARWLEHDAKAWANTTKRQGYIFRHGKRFPIIGKTLALGLAGISIYSVADAAEARGVDAQTAIKLGYAITIIDGVNPFPIGAEDALEGCYVAMDKIEDSFENRSPEWEGDNPSLAGDVAIEWLERRNPALEYKFQNPNGSKPEVGFWHWLFFGNP